MKIKEPCLEEVTERGGRRGWEEAKVENEDERGRSVEGEHMKKRMRRRRRCGCGEEELTWNNTGMKGTWDGGVEKRRGRLIKSKR